MDTNKTVEVLSRLLSTLSVLKNQEIDVEDLIKHTKETLDKTLTHLDSLMN